MHYGLLNALVRLMQSGLSGDTAVDVICEINSWTLHDLVWICTVVILIWLVTRVLPLAQKSCSVAVNRKIHFGFRHLHLKWCQIHAFRSNKAQRRIESSSIWANRVQQLNSWILESNKCHFLTSYTVKVLSSHTNIVHSFVSFNACSYLTIQVEDSLAVASSH